MANHKSAKKRIRRNAKKAVCNRIRRSDMRTAVKKALTVIETGAAEEALQFFRIAESKIQRCVSSGILHKNTAARKVSRMSTRVKAMAA